MKNFGGFIGDTIEGMMDGKSLIIRFFSRLLILPIMLFVFFVVICGAFVFLTHKKMNDIL